MTQQVINIGSAPNDGTGDPLRTSFDKTNENFSELYQGAGSANGGLWNFDATSTDTSTAPVSGRFKTNSGNYRTATQIAIHGTTIQGVDRSYLLRTQLAGDIIQCQDSTNASAWCRYILQATPIDNGGWFQLNVASEVDGGVASGNNQEIVIVCTANNAGVSGGGNVSNVGTPINGQLAQWTDATHIQGIDASSLNFAPINSPTFTGDPKAPTPTAGDNDTSIATTAFVTSAVNGLNIGNYAPIASPTFTGDPKAPTPTAGDNDTSIATTAFVTSAVKTPGGSSNAVQYNNAGSFGGLGPLTNGQLLIGSTGAAAVPATLTAGSNVTITNAAGAVTIAATGAASAGPADAFIATLSADQTGVAANTWTKVNFNTSAYNQNNKFNTSNGRWTPSAGPVQIEAQYQFSLAAAAPGYIAIYKNGASFKVVQMLNNQNFLIVVVDNANGTDYYECYAWSSAANTIGSAISGTFFQGFAIAPQGPAGASPTMAGVWPKMLAGLTLSNDGTTPITVIDIDAGSACSDDNTTMMVLTAANFTKNCNAAWAVGSGNGALDSGSALAASTWYHVFVIMRTDTGAVDVLISTSATSPTMPTNYSKKRRIGSIRTNASSQILAFTQVGDQFLWTSPINDQNNVGYNTAANAYTVSTPPGIKTIVQFAFFIVATANQTYFTFQSPDNTLPAAGNPAGNYNAGFAASAGVGATGELSLRTNTTPAILLAANQSSATGLYIDTKGWTDNRGK
jgi:hypothetical protein